jgi:tellurium resistance protein TerD
VGFQFFEVRPRESFFYEFKKVIKDTECKYLSVFVFKMYGQQQGYPQQQQPGYPQQQQQGYPQQQQQGYPQQQQQGYPQQGLAPPPFAQHYLPRPPPMINKGQMFLLPPQSTVFTMGLGWDTGRYKDLDLDAHVLMVTDKGDLYDHVYHADLKSKDSNTNPAVLHLGDNRTGRGRGDDEQIRIDLARVAPRVRYLYFTVKIWSAKANFGQVNGEYVRLVDNSANGVEVTRFNIDSDAQLSRSDGAFFCTLFREHPKSNRWIFHAVGEGSGKSKKFTHYLSRHQVLTGDYGAQEKGAKKMKAKK